MHDYFVKISNSICMISHAFSFCIIYIIQNENALYIYNSSRVVVVIVIPIYELLLLL